MSTIYQLQRKALHNVDDVAGRWQHEAGNVLQREKPVGQYAIYRRVTFGGTDVQNTAMVTLTIFLEKSKTGAPENITAQGSHDFSSGNEVGSVSAASSGHSSLIGKNFVRNGDTVTFG
jgi:hypothetical protein